MVENGGAGEDGPGGAAFLILRHVEFHVFDHPVVSFGTPFLEPRQEIDGILAGANYECVAGVYVGVIAGGTAGYSAVVAYAELAHGLVYCEVGLAGSVKIVDYGRYEHLDGLVRILLRIDVYVVSCIELSVVGEFVGVELESLVRYVCRVCVEECV